MNIRFVTVVAASRILTLIALGWWAAGSWG
jgi:hypothetical protein